MKVKNIYNNFISVNKGNYLAGKKVKTYLNRIKNFNFFRNPFLDIINCGAPRSGSTIINIIINKIIVLKIQKADNYCGSETDYINKLKIMDRYHLTKTHVYSHLIARRIANKKSIGVFTHRDIRDVIVSYLQKGWVKNVDDFIYSSKLNFYTFDAILHAKTKNMIVISYEELINNRKAVIKLLSDSLNVKLSSEEIDDIYHKTSANYTKKLMNELSYSAGEEKKHDKSTGLHNSHINDPKPDKWKDFLSDEEITKINKSAAEYLTCFKYSL